MHLTNKEKEVMDVLVTGKTDQEIAKDLGVSVNTLKTHLKSIYKKFNARNRLEAVLHHTSNSVAN